MIKNYNVLIIDDHPVIIDAYRNAFSVVSLKNSNYSFKIDTASDCDTAYSKIINSINDKKIDLVMLDIKLPPSKDGKLICGEDLGIRINKLIENVKIIVSTTYNENYRIKSIIKSINPDGLLIKNDIGINEIVQAIIKVIENPPYYSKTVLKLLRIHIQNDLLLDQIDQKLLYELSIGTKMKDLPIILPLSIAGIERRKRRLKEVFDVTENDNKYLLKKAKDKGFI